MNEFKILNNIGRGSFSKVKRVMRQSADGPADDVPFFAMKVSIIYHQSYSNQI